MNRLVGVLLLGVALVSEAALVAEAEVSAAPSGTPAADIPGTKVPDSGPSASAGEPAAVGERGRLVFELTPDPSGLDLRAVGSGQGKVPPSVLSADIAHIPLRKAVAELGRELGAKVFMAEGMGEEAITVRFQKLPVEQGLKRILQGKSYLLIRSKVPAGGKGIEEAQVAEIRVMGQGARGAPTMLKEVTLEPRRQTAELAGLAKQAQEAEKPEERLDALEDFADQAEPSALAGVLVPALKDQDPRVRTLALERMADATDPPLEAMAEMVLRDERAELRSSAIETLVSTHGAAAAPTLEQALRDPNPAVRREAQQGFESIRRMEEWHAQEGLELIRRLQETISNKQQ